MNKDQIIKEQDEIIQKMIKEHLMLNIITGVFCLLAGLMLGLIL